MYIIIKLLKRFATCLPSIFTSLITPSYQKLLFAYSFGLPTYFQSDTARIYCDHLHSTVSSMPESLITFQFCFSLLKIGCLLNET